MWHTVHLAVGIRSRQDSEFLAIYQIVPTLLRISSLFMRKVFTLTCSLKSEQEQSLCNPMLVDNECNYMCKGPNLSESVSSEKILLLCLLARLCKLKTIKNITRE